MDVLIHVIKHDMDPNSNVNYRRKIGPSLPHGMCYSHFGNGVLNSRRNGQITVMGCAHNLEYSISKFPLSTFIKNFVYPDLKLHNQ